MRLKLERLNLPTEAAIETMAASELLVLAKEWRQRIEYYESLLFKARRRMYGPSSERSKSESESKDPTPRGQTTKQLSERYPSARVEVEDIDFDSPQACPACGELMQDSGLMETSEYLDARAKEFIIVEQRRHKHRCSKCHGAIVTAPLPARITPGGSYSDEMIVDATLSKFCDLIPMERYAKMAERSGLAELPPHSLINGSFRLADFMVGVYELIKQEVLASPVLRADETPHRMLEGDEKKRWYFWGFSVDFACFFECHNTRSGDVSTEILNLSMCMVLLTDVYAGYIKSIRLANERRLTDGRPPILPANCNAHARREFWAGDWDSDEMSEDQKIVIEHYRQIYKLNKEAKDLCPDGILQKRAEMRPHFEAIKAEAERKIDTYSNKSQMYKAYNYFLKNYEGLTLFLTNHLVPIDNNGSERNLRSHVVGRKTWYGTHSQGGARTAAIHFTIVESCKLNNLNPREYYLAMINRIHARQELMTPRQYKLHKQTDTS